MNFRRLSIFSVCAAMALGMLAVPARRGTRVMTQADGTTVSLHLIGDEHFHTFCTTDGMAVRRMPDGNFYYRTASGVTSVVAHDPSHRSEAEQAFIASGVDLSVASLVSAESLRIKARRSYAHGRAPRKASQVPSSGAPRVVVLLVQYKDYKFKDADPKATFTEFFRSGASSANQYFVDQSNGKYNPQFDVYGPVTLSGNRVAYGGNDSNGDDVGVGHMVAEGCLALDSQIDFSRYDNDGDGECDVVIVLYAGDGEASSYDQDAEDAVWPCQWALSSSDSDYGKALTLDGTTVDRFAVFNELNGSDLSRIDGIGTFCHEFSHCLDLPDFYDTQYGPHFGMADWSLMDSGCYNNEGYTPIGYSAYEKAFMGWMDLEEAADNTYYTLPVLNKVEAPADRAVKITNPADEDEYYILENRANQGWDRYMPAEGLLITHVTYSQAAWYDNTVNDYDMQRMTPIPADNSLKMDKETYWGETYYIVNADDLKGDLWPYGSSTELTDKSTPAAKVNTGSYMGKPVTEISRNADGTISFWTMKTPKPTVTTPGQISHRVESASSVTVSWTPGDDNDVIYTLEVKEHHDVTYKLVETVDFTDNNHGWSTTGYASVETDGLRLGSNKQLGSVTSPSFTVDEDGLVTVWVNAEYYGSDGSKLKISLIDATGTVADSKTVTLGASYADYSALLRGTAGKSMSVRFETIASKKRAYISSASIYTGDATELDPNAISTKAGATDDTTYRLVSGLKSTSCTVTGLKDYGIFDYRVKAVPTDSESWDESPWSESAIADLSGGASVVSVEAESSDIMTPEYYTLHGVRVNAASLAPGIYIRKTGDIVEKIVIK